MKSTTIKLRVPTEELERWRVKAAEKNQNLSEFVRGCCAWFATALSAAHVMHDPADVEQHLNAVKRAVAGRRSARGRSHGSVTQEIVAPRRSLSQMQDVRMAPADPAARCAHGRQSGELCYKCDEGFGYPRC